MPNIIKLSDFRRHARASAGSGAAPAWRANKRSGLAPKSTKPGHRRTGIDRRAIQLETVEGSTPKLTATFPVPPNSEISVEKSSSMAGQTICSLQTSQALAKCRGIKAVEAWPNDRAMDKKAVVAKRLVATREALGISQADMYRALKLKRQSDWNPFETGERMITVRVALKLRARFAVGLNWTYAGDADDLPKNIRDKIDIAALAA